MNIQVLAAWLLQLMVLAVPPGKGQLARSLETSAAQEERYERIAEAIATVVLDEKEAPVFAGKGDGPRVRTAAMLLSVSYFESSWRRDVDLGMTRGDGGKSCTVFQFNLGSGKTAEGWGCDELVADRGKAARSALHALRRSSLACRKETGPEAILFVYVSGDCDGDRLAAKVFAPGTTIRDVAAKRMEKARRWTAEHPFSKFAAVHPAP